MHARHSFLRLVALASFVLLFLTACNLAPSPQPDANTLTVAVDGSGDGTVTSEPAGIDCPGQCEADFDADTEVTLTATPGENATFAGWGGACSGTGDCTVTMSEAQDVTATFDSAGIGDGPSLTVNVQGDGTVTSEPAGIDCPGQCQAEFEAETEVTLTATPGENATFAGWSGACEGAEACTVTVTEATEVTATFDGEGDTVTETFTIQASPDDAEELVDGAAGNGNFPPGVVQEASTDLDMHYDTSTESATYVGLRFAGVSIPAGAVVTSAHLTFSPDGGGAGTVTIDIFGQAADDPATFEHVSGESTNGISGRETTAANASWSVTDLWTAPVDSPDLAAVVQEIVDREGWAAGNAMVFILSSPDSDPSNYRNAASFDDGPAAAPQLEVTYTVP